MKAFELVLLKNGYAKKKPHESIFTKSTVARRREAILEDSNFGYYCKIRLN